MRGSKTDEARQTRRYAMACGLRHGTCDGRVVSVLEGGDNLQGLGSAAAAHVEALLS